MKKFALVGNNISYTVSPFIHQRLFDVSGSNHLYSVIDVAEQNLPEALSGLDGFNVTKPYKQVVTRLIRRLDSDADVLGSVNTVSGDSVGYNTDVPALEKTLSGMGKSLSEKLLLLGFGGLGKAVAVRAIMCGGDVTVAVRKQSIEKTVLAVNELKTRFLSAKIAVCDIQNISGHFDLLINTTPVGTLGNHLSCPISDNVIKRTDAVFDCVYNPLKTSLVRRAEKLDVPASGGLEMLVRQAAEAQNVWLGSTFSETDVAKIVNETADKLKEFKSNVVLTGFMAAGKTSLARKLGQITAFDVLDIDGEIEKCGKSISDLFLEGGETAFRKLEKQVVCRAASSYSTIIATGGGTVLDDDNVNLLKKTGTIVFIDLPFDAVYERLSTAPSGRPLADGKTRDELKALFDTRRKVYLSTADVVVDGNLPLNELADAVISRF